MKQYRANNGNWQWKPSFTDLMRANDSGGGFCLACGAEHDCVEPYARKYHCTDCRAHKVYGAEELALMNLYHMDRDGARATTDFWTAFRALHATD